METIAQEARRLLEPIPDEQWLVGAFSDGESKCCAFGHYARINSVDQNDFSMENCSKFQGRLGELADSILVFTKGMASLVGVNDGVTHYTKHTPKQRVMALLDDMIAAGY